MSAIGNSLYGFAAGLFVQDMYKDIDKALGARYLALFMFISIFINVIFSPLAGVLVDKWNKIRILYITDWIRGILFLGTFLLIRNGVSGTSLINLLLLATAISSFNQAFFSPASTSVIPEVVGEKLIQQANGANSIIQSVQTIAGVVAGIFLYELLGFEIVVLMNAISFMLSAITEMFIKTNYTPFEEEITLKSFFSDFKFGLGFIKRKEGFFTMMMFSLILNFAFTPLFAVGIPYLFRTELNSSTFAIGALDIVFSVSMLVAGVIVGSMKIKNLNNTVRMGVISLSSSFVLSTVFIILVTYGYIEYWTFYGLFILANILLAATMMYTNVPLNTAMMKAIDPEVRGRVFGTISSLSQGAIPFAILFAGEIIARSNTAILGIFCSILVIIISIVYITNQKITRMIRSIDEEDKVNVEMKDVAYE